MDAELKARAESVAALQNSKTGFSPEQIAEIGQVHYLLTGRKVACTGCKVYGLIREVNSLLTKSKPKTEIMANDKGQFKQSIDVQLVVRHTPNGLKYITPENLNTGDNLEWALKNFPNLIETIEAPKEAAGDSKEQAPAKTSRKRKIK